VRVVIFPEGEDPDSYSKKIGSTAFNDYLKEKSEDFISYKTALYTREAGGDPIKKADTIKEILGSVAKVPDPIKRAVYVKQCSDLLEMDEHILITELNKLLRKNDQKKPAVQPDSNQDIINILDEIEADPERDANLIIALQERESIRLLI